MSEASFQPAGYLKFDLSQGLLSTPDKRRHIVIPAELLRVLGSQDELESLARRWGEEQGNDLVKLIGGDALSKSPERFVTELSHLMATLGWGWCDLESWGGVLFLVVQGSPRGDANKILSKFIAGVFTSASSKKFECVCFAEDSKNRFLLTGPEHVGTIQKWVDSGATAGEVASRMQSGDHLSSSAGTGGV